jgi:hypothetical protein
VHVIYDIAYVPAAVKRSGTEVFQQLDSLEAYVAVFVMCEYSEEEADVPFDPNDITWFQVFVLRNDGTIEKVFDDETA